MMSKKKVGVQSFAQTLIREHGKKFAELTMQLTQMPAHSTTFSRVFNVLFRRTYTNYQSKAITSIFASAIKNMTDDKDNFADYMKKHWGLPVAYSIPNGLRFDASNFCYDKASHPTIYRLNLMKQLEGVSLVDELVKLSINTQYSSKKNNAKSQVKKYLHCPFNDSKQYLMNIDTQIFPLWFKRDNSRYLCEQLASGLSFDEACEITNQNIFQILGFIHNKLNLSHQQKMKIIHRLDDLFDDVKQQLAHQASKKDRKVASEHVYFVALDHQQVKVGGSKSNERLEERLKEHHRNYPELRLFISFPVTDYKKIENAIKSIFCAKFQVLVSHYQDPLKAQELDQGAYFTIKSQLQE
ncbi:hypothetical protein D5R81_19545 [Parashewanella spongiae]|uniref:Uncharacterized protein n=1 Tax=Parashewanella spongiae TaxID=342950 RepID=A0A3A6T1H6_9GAMM|nr:hypothetical protein [Parashewanella spongiae]MCL1080216.1 hypothetical protein [Parashewanella spongiae]RJY02119.1 hypothetical protein D5R81_19545 [Parashewanella spongiae]